MCRHFLNYAADHVLFSYHFVTLKKVYDGNVVNKYRIYFYLIDYISICTVAEVFISFYRYA